MRRSNIATGLILALCCWVYIRMNIIRPIPTLPGLSDFLAYFHTAQDVLHGKSPYVDPALFYPPLLPFLMVPLGLISYEAARWTWFILSHVFLLGAAVLLWRDMGKSRIALCCIAAIWAFGGAINETLRQGQLSPLLVLLLTIAYTQRKRIAGVSAGLCFALKYFPGIVAIPLLLGRQWRALAASIAAGVGGVLVPWLIIAAFLTGPIKPVSATYWMGTPSMFSWSIPSVVLRILIPIHRGAPYPNDWEFGNVAFTLHLNSWLQWSSVAAAITVFLAGLTALALVSRLRLNTRQIPWAMAGLVSLSLAVAPVSWTHYQILQYPGVAMLLIAAIRERRLIFGAGTALSFALVYQLPQYFLIAYHNEHGAWTTASPATLYFWTTAPPVAALAIFALSLCMVRRERFDFPAS